MDRTEWVFISFGFVFSFIALFFVPPLFGGVGIWFGIKIKKYRYDPLPIVIIVLNIIGMLVGMWLFLRLG